MSLAARIGLAALASACGAAAAAGAWKAPTTESSVSVEVAVAPTSTNPLPPTDPTAGPSLIDRSPFAPDRGPFARNAGPPPPELEVRLAGIFKVGKHLRATLVVGGQTLTVGKGDETPVGPVGSIEPTAIVLEGASPRRLELFKK